jgi:hypothetical protein
MIDPAESLLACTGLGQVLAGKPPAPADVSRSLSLEEDLRDAVRSYLRGRKRAPGAVRPLQLPPSLPETAHGAVRGLDPQVAILYGMAAARALAYLNALVPARALPGLRQRMAERTAAEATTMRRCTAAIEDPLGVLGDIDGLAEDQIATLRAVYPTLVSELALCAAEAMADEDRDLTGRQERALGRLLGVAPPDVSTLQQLHRHEEGKGKAAQAGGGPSPGLATPLQELSGK